MPSGRHRRVRTGLWSLRVVAALLLLLTLSIDRGTGALWSDTGTVPGGTIRTGRIDLQVDGQDAVADYAPLDLSLLVPGTTTAAVLSVQNAGNVDLSYTLATSGTDSDGAHLLNALALLVTAANTTTSGSTGPTCAGSALPGSSTTAGGALVSAARTLAAGGSEQICVQVGLPLTAPASAAGGATSLTISADAANGGWSDSVAVAGTQLSAAVLTPPTLSCGPAGLLSITVSWAAVPGATAYRIHSGLLGATVTTVPAGTLSRTFTATSGLVWVQAVFGSDDWISADSTHRTYSALAGPGMCS